MVTSSEISKTGQMLCLKMDVSREQICENRNTKDAIVSFYMQKYKSDKSHQAELQAVFNANSGASCYLQQYHMGRASQVPGSSFCPVVLC